MCCVPTRRSVSAEPGSLAAPLARCGGGIDIAQQQVDADIDTLVYRNNHADRAQPPGRAEGA